MVRFVIEHNKILYFVTAQYFPQIKTFGGVGIWFGFHPQKSFFYVKFRCFVDENTVDVGQEYIAGFSNRA